MVSSGHKNLEVKQTRAKLTEDQALPTHFAPPLQQLILEGVGYDIDVKSEAKSYPYKGLKLFNEEQDVITLLWNRLKLQVKELAKQVEELPIDQKKLEEYKNKQADLRILAIKYPHLIQDNKLLVEELFPDLHEFNPAALADYYVLWGGEPEELKILIQNHPELLNQVTEARDWAGRPVKGTLYQKALGAGDYEMAEMLEAFLTPEEADRQYDEQFPEGWEEAAEKKLAENLKALDAVWQTLKDAKTENVDTEENLAALKIECKPAVDKFKQHLLSENKEVITAGYHNDLRFLLKAIEHINQKIDEIGGWWKPKDYLFWEQIFGSMQLRVSARDMHELLRGLYYFDENKPAPRVLKFKDGTSVRGRSSLGLLVGVDSLIDYLGGGARGGSVERRGRVIGSSMASKLMSSKNGRVAKFTRRRDKHPAKKGRCTIM